MPIPLQFRVHKYEMKGLFNADRILVKHSKIGLASVGKVIQESARSFMWKDTGAGQKNLKISINGTGLDLNVQILGNLVQLFVQAYGIRPGTFPPTFESSPLFQWTKRKLASGHWVRRNADERLASHLSRRPESVKQKLGIKSKSPERLGRTKRVVKKSRRTKKSGEAIKSPNADKRLRMKNSNVKRVAFLVARKIFEHGIKPNHWNTKALEQNKSKVVAMLGQSLINAVNEINRTR